LACTLEFALAAGPTVPEGVKTLTDFFAWCKAHPDQASFGSPAEGSVPYFIGRLVAKTADIDWKHVDFGGTRAMLRGVTDGRVAVASAPIGDFLPELAAGKLRLLGVSGKSRSRFVPNVPTYVEQGLTDMVFSDWYGFFLPELAAGKLRLLGVSGKSRSRFVPNVPTYVEQGLTDMVFSEWYGFFLPGDASASVVLRANEALRTALKRPDVVDHLAQVALEAKSSTPGDLATRLKADKERWGPLLRRIGVDIDQDN
jgi:tripartite-type tricarboxylate transporter receptor subunit TctC